MQRTITSFSFAIAALACGAQSMTEALADVNAVFGGSVQVKLDRRQQLVFDLYDASGRFRQDIVLPSDIDTASIHFSLEEDAIILGCRADKPQCISKEIFKLNTVRLTGRSNLPRPPQDSNGTVTAAALRRLFGAAGLQLAATGGETRPRR
ncbi:MAG: hypothetical protein IPL52_04040 [Flavobacteriales bacterium]|nr:hypothetical protein [Flavobacteriales bacterium]